MNLSSTHDKNMIVQKTYSNVEDQEERLYSVLLTEEEMRIFNDLQGKMFSKKDEMNDEEYGKAEKKIKKNLLKSAAGLGVAGLGAAGSCHHGFKALGENTIEAASKNKKLAAASTIASLAGSAYAIKKLHDVNKIEKDPRYANRFNREMKEDMEAEDKYYEKLEKKKADLKKFEKEGPKYPKR